MPFDGLNFVSSPTIAKIPVLTRLSHLLFRAPPVAKTFPPHALAPAPAGQPDAVTLQVLTIGRALIEDRKDWVQRRYETRDGRRCAVGALRAAARLLDLEGPQTGGARNSRCDRRVRAGILAMVGAGTKLRPSNGMSASDGFLSAQH